MYLYSMRNEIITRQPSCAHVSGFVPWRRSTRRQSGDGVVPNV